jgi:small subunit ribosomal protein S35
MLELSMTESFPKFNGDDIPSGAHLALHQQRQVTHYLRLIENEMPKFVGKLPTVDVFKAY